MFNKLREKTGKRFVLKYEYGKPIFQSNAYAPGTTVGEKRTLGPKVVSWDGTSWIDEGFNLNPAELMPQLQKISSTNSTTNTQSPDVLTTMGAGLLSPGDTTDLKALAGGFVKSATGQDTSGLTGDAAKGATMAINAEEHATSIEQVQRAADFAEGFGGTADGTIGSAIGNFKDGNWKTGLVDTAMAGIKAIDSLAMGDKNFGAQSEAIDSAVHGVSGALLKSGNPYAMAAGAALEGANFLTKAGGQTVQGFDVDINSSGYGQLGHMESSSSRDFGAMIGLGGVFGQKKLQRKLQKRNEQALMAMNAANIAEDQAFEQEARMNSIQNTIMNNQMALAGGLDTSLLGG